MFGGVCGMDAGMGWGVYIECRCGCAMGVEGPVSLIVRNSSFYRRLQNSTWYSWLNKF